MNGNQINRNPVGTTGSPRLPPLSQDIYQGQSANVLLDQSYGFNAAMQQSNLDDRRSRQILEDQVKVITAVCKKLNQDIEVLDSQLNEKSYQFNNLENKTNDVQANSFSQMKDIQFKVSRHETNLMKIENDHHSLTNAIQDIQSQIQDNNRSTLHRINETDKRVIIS